MLDNCSQGCFVKFSHVKNLRIKGQKASVSVKTGEETHIFCCFDG